jgi:hypothetical protein
MEDFYGLSQSARGRIDELSPEVKQLHSRWVDANLDEGDLVHMLYTTGHYVDNEFYRQIGIESRQAGRAYATLNFGHMESVLVLRSYEKNVPEEFEQMWREKIGGPLAFDYQRNPIYISAREIGDVVMSEFGTAFRDDPNKAYEEGYSLVQRFVEVMQDSRLLLKAS